MSPACFTVAACAPRRVRRATMTADPAQRSGVNVNRYKSQRAILATEAESLQPEEVNSLLRRAGREVGRCRPAHGVRSSNAQQARDETMWRSAIDNSFCCVTARLIANRRLVGFARATSDHALNGTIWDVVTDPQLPDEVRPRRLLATHPTHHARPSQLSLRRKVLVYLLKELRRSVPGCSIALFSTAEDRAFYESLDFVADPDGIRGMALYETDFEC